MQVPILKQGAYLIATVQSALTDEDLKQLRDTLVLQVSKVRARGVIVDVTALDVIDSFATRTLRDVAYMIRLRGLHRRDQVGALLEDRNLHALSPYAECSTGSCVRTTL